MSLHFNEIAQMLIKQINIWETQLYTVSLTWKIYNLQ